MKLVSYIRVSTDDQKTGLEVYQKQCERFCETFNHELIQSFVDEDVSGKIEFKKRPQGKLCYELLMKGNVGIITPNLSRIFRDAQDGMNTGFEFSNKGIVLYFTDMGGMPVNLKTSTGFMSFSMQLIMSHIERLMIIERTTNALKIKRENGQATSHVPFGFDKVGKSLVPNAKEQLVVDLINDLVERKLSFLTISESFNDKGIKSKKGGKWTSKTVKGVYEYNLKVKG
jgi:DNA invertase Pin-like site-specific DNA recombinase